MTPKSNFHLMIISALVAAFLLPACAPQSATETPAPMETTTIMPDTSKKDLTIWMNSSPTTLNPYLAGGEKDLEPSRISYEPLATFDSDGNLVPILAAEIPSVENGDLDANKEYVTWRLRQDVFWSDGKPFTADDVKFTYEYVIDPEVKSVATAEYSQIVSVEALDDFTVKVTFENGNPAWSTPFVGTRGVILPRHIFEAYKGANARNAEANTVPVGTGPYRVKKPEDGQPAIKPQEVILLGLQVVKTTKIVFEPNPKYRFPDKLAFKQVIWRGGGGTDLAKRQLLDEGVLDIVYRFPIESLDLLGNGSKAKLVSSFIPGVDQLYINRTDPFTPSADGEYSSREVPHPLFSDKVVRQAFAYAINHDELAAVYGALGKPAYVTLIAPPQFQSSKIFYEYNTAKANDLLDKAGYLDENKDGFREKDGVKMKVVFVTTTSPILQQEQKIIQKNLGAIGIDVEIKQVDSSILFGDDTTNPDSEFRFNSDMMMFNQSSDSPNPSSFMENWTCARIPQKSNDWTAGNNDQRWCNPEYDALLGQANVELDDDNREKMFIKLNEMLVEDVVMIPLVWPARAFGVNVNLTGFAPTPWDTFTWNMQDWHFIQP